MTKAASVYTRLPSLLLAGILAAAASPAFAQKFELVEWVQGTFGNGTTSATPVRYGIYNTSAACSTSLTNLENADASRFTEIGVSAPVYIGGLTKTTKNGICVQEAPSTYGTAQAIYTLQAAFQNPTTQAITISEVQFGADTLTDCNAKSASVAAAMTGFTAGSFYTTSYCD